MVFLRTRFSPVERLTRRVAQAADTRYDPRKSCQTLDDLQAAIYQDLSAVVAIASSDPAAEVTVMRACRTLADLYSRSDESDREEHALAILQQLYEYPFGRKSALEGLSELVAGPACTERAVSLLAEWLCEAGRIGDAILTIRTALQESLPRSVSLSSRLGKLLSETGEFAEAATHYRTVFHLAPELAEQVEPELAAIVTAAPELQIAQQTLGQVALRLGHYPQAAQHLQAATSLGQVDMNTLFDLAEAYCQSDTPDEAIEILEQLSSQAGLEPRLILACRRLLEHWPHHARAWRVLGDVYRRQQRWDEALESYRSALDHALAGQLGQDMATSLIGRLEKIALRSTPAVVGLAHLELGRARTQASMFTAAVQAYTTAWSNDRTVAPRVIEELSNIVAVRPDVLEARLLLVDLYIGTEDLAGALDALEKARHELPDLRQAFVDRYQNLLTVLSGTDFKKGTPAGRQIAVPRDVLYALAELAADTHPASATAYLNRVLGDTGADEATGCLDKIESLGLLLADPVGAPLLTGDCHLALHDVVSAVKVYRQVPVKAETLPVVIARLDRAASADATGSGALLAAGCILLSDGEIGQALPYFQRALDREPDQAARQIVSQLDPSRRRGTLPPDALVLLAEAQIILGVPLEGLNCYQMLLGVDPSRAQHIIERCNAVARVADTNGPAYAQAMLLQGEALLTAGRPQEAVESCAHLIGHPQIDELRQIAVLQRATQPPHSLPVAWLVIGDVYAQRGDLSSAQALEAYERAMQANPVELAGQVIERLGRMKPDLPTQLLRAAALQKQEQWRAASHALLEVLDQFGIVAMDRLDKLAQSLPDTPVAWFVKLQVSIIKALPEQAGRWAELIIERGEPEDVTTVEHILREIVVRFPDSPNLQLALGHALERQGRLADGAIECARGYALMQDVPAVLHTLAPVLADPTVAASAHTVLQSIAADRRYRSRADVLAAQVRVETALATDAALEQAAEHCEIWLAEYRDQAAQVYAACERLTAQLDGSQPTGALALRAHLGMSDALVALDQLGLAVPHLRLVLDRWAEADEQVLTRCEQVLGAESDVATRLLIVDIYITAGQYRAAVDLCRSLSREDAAPSEKLAEHCRRIVAVTEINHPSEAGQAAAVLAELSARRGDVEAMLDHLRRAVGYDAEQVTPAADYLEREISGGAWSQEQRRTLLYGVAGLLRDAGSHHFERSLNLYRRVFETEPAQGLTHQVEALDGFSPDYLPARYLSLDADISSGPACYPHAFEVMRTLLARFGSPVVDDLLAKCTFMDSCHTDVHLMRIEIYEAGERWPQAIEALHGMRRAFPAQSSTVEQVFTEIIKRHPTEHQLKLGLADMLLEVGNLDGALAQYTELQASSNEWMSTLIDRYHDIVTQQPTNVPALWGLARAYRTVGEPSPAAECMDKLTDLGYAEARPFLATLTDSWPECGLAWFVRGKLAYGEGDYARCIEYMQRALSHSDTIPAQTRGRLYLLQGQAHRAMGELDIGLDKLLQAVTFLPDERSVRDALAVVRQAQLDRAIVAKEREIELGHPSPEAHIALCDLYRQRGRYVDAIQRLRQVIAGLPVHHPDRSRTWLKLGRCFEEAGLYHLAASSLETVLGEGDLDQDTRKSALYHLALADRRLMRFDAAAAALEQLYILDANYQNASELVDLVRREQALARHRPVAINPVSGVQLLETS